MSVHIYNQLSRRKEAFSPLVPGKAGMYVCGVTVYDASHIGHGRVMVVFDVILRWLQESGFDVNYVRNFTDVDDKIIRRAAEKNISCESLTSEMIDKFYVDMDALGCIRPTVEPKATEHIDKMLAMIQKLVDQGFAYPSKKGDVLFSVRKFKGYGKLSGKKLDELEAGSRVEVDESKQDPLDFVLWKASKPGEPAWDSPWGAGRPGWHIECSAMSCHFLGETFDIHGGGKDLQFPHHENEIAQSEACNQKTFAKYWIHNGFVNINQEKMSKSLGNFFAIEDVCQTYPPEVLRFFYLSTHYRSPIDFSDGALDAAKQGLDRLYETRRRIGDDTGVDVERIIPDRFQAAMDDDFNTPEALAEVFDCAREINRKLDAGNSANSEMGYFYAMTSLLGVVQNTAKDWFQSDSELDVALIERLINQRNQARQDKDFRTSDDIRDQLAAMNVELEDSPTGTRWKKN